MGYNCLPNHNVIFNEYNLICFCYLLENQSDFFAFFRCWLISICSIWFFYSPTGNNLQCLKIVFFTRGETRNRYYNGTLSCCFIVDKAINLNLKLFLIELFYKPDSSKFLFIVSLLIHWILTRTCCSSSRKNTLLQLRTK